MNTGRTGEGGGVSENNLSRDREEGRGHVYQRLQEGSSSAALEGSRWGRGTQYRRSSAFSKDSRSVNRSVFGKYREYLVSNSTSSKGIGDKLSASVEKKMEEEDLERLPPYINTEQQKSLEGPHEGASSWASIRSSNGNGRVQSPGGVAGGVASSVAGTGNGGKDPCYNGSSFHKAEVHQLLSLSDVEATFMNFTMASTPTQQLLQLRVLELFQEWVTSPGVQDTLNVALQVAQRQVGFKPWLREAWKLEPSISCPPISNNGGGGIGEEQHPNSQIVERRHRFSDGIRNSKSEERQSGNGSSSFRNGNSDDHDDGTGFYSSPRSQSVSPTREHDRRRGGSSSPLAEPPPLIKLVVRRGEESTPESKRSTGQDSPKSVDRSKESGDSKGREESTGGSFSAFFPSSSRQSRGRRCGASYEDIPRFYFPLGKPTTREKVISEPLFKFHENPHLQLSENVIAVAPRAGGMGSAAGRIGEGGDSGNGIKNVEGFSLVNEIAPLTIGGTKNTGGPDEKVVEELLLKERGLQPKIPPMSTLHLVDDHTVLEEIKKEFARMCELSRHRKARASSSRRALSGVVKESQLRQHFYVCMERICTECLGVPKYFAYLIIGLIQLQLEEAGVSSSSTESASGSAPFISSQIYSSIKAEHVHEFYEKYLKHKDTVRRTFDLLILSSRLSTNMEKQEEEGEGGGGKKSGGDGTSSSNSEGGTENSSANKNRGGKKGVKEDLTTLRAHLEGQDFMAYIITLLFYHPGLRFLGGTPEFQLKYMDTVIYRIFYDLDRFDRERISFGEFEASPLLDAFRELDATEDVNSVLLYFSYEHFYVLCSRFGDLDMDRDLMLSKEDLMDYAPQGSMNPLVVDRVFKGAGRRKRCNVPDRIGYEDFVWFCLSEEDKSTVPAIRYWFKVLDTDEDGVLSVYELKAFFDATAARGGEYLQENPASFENTICQVFDMLRCGEYRGLRLKDLLADRVASYVAINMITSIAKFIQFEFKDPFVSHQERLSGSLEQTPWDRFARMEYDRMAVEGEE